MVISNSVDATLVVRGLPTEAEVIKGTRRIPLPNGKVEMPPGRATPNIPASIQ